MVSGKTSSTPAFAGAALMLLFAFPDFSVGQAFQPDGRLEKLPHGPAGGGLAVLTLEGKEEKHLGTIDRVCKRSLVLVVHDGKTVKKTFCVTEKTAIKLDGKPAELSDLQPGYRACVKAEKLGVGLLAVRITALSNGSD